MGNKLNTARFVAEQLLKRGRPSKIATNVRRKAYLSFFGKNSTNIERLARNVASREAREAYNAASKEWKSGKAPDSHTRTVEVQSKSTKNLKTSDYNGKRDKGSTTKKTLKERKLSTEKPKAGMSFGSKNRPTESYGRVLDAERNAYRSAYELETRRLQNEAADQAWNNSVIGKVGNFVARHPIMTLAPIGLGAFGLLGNEDGPDIRNYKSANKKFGILNNNVKAYQQLKGLPETGELDDVTIQSMEKDWHFANPNSRFKIPNKPINDNGELTPECAEFVNATLRLNGVPAYGHAFATNTNPGFSKKFSGYDYVNPLNRRGKQDIYNMNLAASDSLAAHLNLDELDPQRIYTTNMAYQGSSHILDFYNKAIAARTGSYGTHTGILYNDGSNWKVIHNVHLRLHNDPIDDLLGSKNGNPAHITNIYDVGYSFPRY